MDGYDIKEVMEQVHISSEMQEKVIMNVKNRMESGNKNVRGWNFRKMAAAAAAVALTAVVISTPVRAFVASVVAQRMESVPREEMEGLNVMVQSQHVLADGFSREYSDSEKERGKALRKEYENGTFPEKAIAQADSAQDVTEGTLCYIRDTGVFQLPAQEMTDEELLEIIDFQNKMKYAVSQSPASQKAKMEEEEKQLKENVQAADGISEEEAIEIAVKQMEAELGEGAKGKEIARREDGSVVVLLLDISGETGYEHKGDMAYLVGFSNPVDHSSYTCTIDALDGSILYTTN